MRTTIFIAATTCALQFQQRRPRRQTIRMISERQIPAYVETMKLYESETGVETLPACGSACIKLVEHDGSHLISHSQGRSSKDADAGRMMKGGTPERMGGWTTKRHAITTTDVPVQELPRTHTWFRERL